LNDSEITVPSTFKSRFKKRRYASQTLLQTLAGPQKRKYVEFGARTRKKIVHNNKLAMGKFHKSSFDENFAESFKERF